MRFKDKAYVIHATPYRETSAIIRVLSRKSGLLSGVAKGVYGKGRQSAVSRSALQTGNLVEFQWQGTSSLKSFFGIELVECIFVDSAKKFVCLSYVNELLSYLLPEEQQAENIFSCYHDFLQQINDDLPIEPLLRRFELDFLEYSGYGIDFTWDSESQEPIDEASLYSVVPATGVRRARDHDRIRISGRDLLLLSRQDFADDSVLFCAKKINRMLIDYHLDGRILKTRKMYQELFSQ